jgi:hypothetical protein
MYQHFRHSTTVLIIMPMSFGEFVLASSLTIICVRSCVTLASGKTNSTGVQYCSTTRYISTQTTPKRLPLVAVPPLLVVLKKDINCVLEEVYRSFVPSNLHNWIAV